MHKLAIVLGTTLLHAAASAQQIMQCPNPDALNSLVFNARPEARLTLKRTMPDIVAGFRAPAGFSLIGSGSRPAGNSTVVAYKTQLDGGKALDDLVGFLEAEGWRRETPQAAQAPGFTVPVTPRLAAVLCREGDRRSVLVHEAQGVRYATISGGQPSPPRACNAPNPQVNFDPMTGVMALQAQMPKLSFPDTARIGGPVSGFGGGANTTSQATRIETAESATSVATYLARQLANQGWRADAQWNGALSTGSTWLRTADDGRNYQGMLEILNLGSGAYEVTFSASTRRQ